MLKNIFLLLFVMTSYAAMAQMFIDAQKTESRNNTVYLKGEKTPLTGTGFHPGTNKSKPTT